MRTGFQNKDGIVYNPDNLKVLYAEDMQDVADELDLRALNCINQFSITNYTFDGTEIRNSGYAVVTTGGNRTVNINADLFSTGFEVIICKFTDDANTVTIDAQAGNVIDGSQTYVLTKYNETIVLVKDGTNTWKIKSSHIGKASDFVTPTNIATLENKTVSAPKLIALNLGNLGATEAIDWNIADIFYGIIDSNVTITHANEANGRTITIHLAYDGAAQRVITWSHVDRWTDNASGAVPATPSAAGQVLTVTMQFYGNVCVASATGNYPVYA